MQQRHFRVRFATNLNGVSKVTLIRAIRDLTGCGLKEAKDLSDDTSTTHQLSYWVELDEGVTNRAGGSLLIVRQAAAHFAFMVEENLVVEAPCDLPEQIRQAAITALQEKRDGVAVDLLNALLKCE